jgi:hypothetical protein
VEEEGNFLTRNESKKKKGILSIHDVLVNERLTSLIHHVSKKMGESMSMYFDGRKKMKHQCISIEKVIWNQCINIRRGRDRWCIDFLIKYILSYIGSCKKKILSVGPTLCISEEKTKSLIWTLSTEEE